MVAHHVQNAVEYFLSHQTTKELLLTVVLKNELERSWPGIIRPKNATDFTELKAEGRH